MERTSSTLDCSTSRPMRTAWLLEPAEMNQSNRPEKVSRFRLLNSSVTTLLNSTVLSKPWGITREGLVPL